ncbi:MAG: NifU family protein [bacterium]|nr:NifU family protein [bacterium]
MKAKIETQTLKDRIFEVLEKDVKPFLALHGGDAELKKVEEGIVTVALKGACHGCSMAAITFQMGVEQMLIDKFPEEIIGLEYE